MLVIDIFLYGMDFVKSSYRKMFLEEFRQIKDIKKLFMEEVLNVVFK